MENEGEKNDVGVLKLLHRSCIAEILFVFMVSCHVPCICIVSELLPWLHCGLYRP